MLYRMTNGEFSKLEKDLREKQIPFGYISPFGAVVGDKTKIVLEEDCNMPEPYNYEAFIEGYWVYIDYDFGWRDLPLQLTKLGLGESLEQEIIVAKDVIIVPASKPEKEQAEYKDYFFIMSLIENLIEVGML